MANPVVVDLFAGGGGASLGIRDALGVCPVIAVNHDEAAIAMHAANHPNTLHLREDVFKVDPGIVPGAIDLTWASPDCTHHSRAKGGKPRDQGIRGLAWVVVEWARTKRPARIVVENVSEFQEWGPLDDAGTPIRERRGETFRQWVGSLRLLGYAVEWRVLNCADYGAPTSRKRLFIIARCDGVPIRWPVPTHGPGRLPYRTAAECIDWSDLGGSIFERSRPLAEATERRIAEGLRRYLLNSPRPFLVNLTHGGRLDDIDAPVKTITAAHRGEKSLVAPWLIHTGNGERAGQTPRTYDPTRPLGTVVAGGQKHGLVAAWLAKHYGGPRPQVASAADTPIGAVTARDHHSLAAAHLLKFYGTSHGAPVDGPLHTITGQGFKHGLVAAFLCKYYGNGGQWAACDEPMHTIVSKARFGLVTVEIEGQEYAIVDITMRMLQPRELATAQGFPASYILTGNKTQQIARIGNSVPPPVVAAIVRAQFERHDAAMEAA